MRYSALSVLTLMALALVGCASGQVSPGASESTRSASVKMVELHQNGIGQFEFGAPEAAVLAYLAPILGKPEVHGSAAGGCEGAGSGYQSYAEFDHLTVRFAAEDDSSKSSRTMESWEAELTSAQEGRLRLASAIPFGMSLTQLKAKYPDGDGLEHMNAWAAEGVWLVPPEEAGGAEIIHAGDLDWCT